MFLIRMFFWVALVAFFLPVSLTSSYPEIPSATEPVLSGPSFDPSKADDAFMGLAKKAGNFCEDYALACNIGSAALHKIHVQAVFLTGALHDWLEAQL